MLEPLRSNGGVDSRMRRNPPRLSSAGLCDPRLVFELGRCRFVVIPGFRTKELLVPVLPDVDPPKELECGITSPGLASKTALSYFA